MLRRRGIGRTVARTAVIAGTATAVSGGMMRHQQSKAQQEADAEAWREQQAAAQAPPPPPAVPAAPPAPPPASDMDAKIAQLTKLGELHSQGILTDEELAAEKAKIL
jgi:hypothetical protein